MSKKTLNFTPNPVVCARLIEITLNGEMIDEVIITGGCPGNSLALKSLLRGMDRQFAIARLKGIDCQRKGTSCADQLADALIELGKKQS